MPKNCSSDVQAVVAHFDAVAHDPKAVAALKAQFGMEDVEHYDDVTSTRTLLSLHSLTIRNSIHLSQESDLHMAGPPASYWSWGRLLCILRRPGGEGR